MSQLQVGLTGLTEALRELRQFPKSVHRKGTRIALSAAAGVMKSDLPKRVPRETGTLAKSMGVRVKVSEETAYAIVGPKRGIKVAVAANKQRKQVVIARYTKKKDGTTRVTGQRRFDRTKAAGKRIRYRVPSRYAHLVEGGTKRGVKASRYMKRSIEATKGAAESRATEKLRQVVDEEARKAAGRSRRGRR